MNKERDKISIRRLISNVGYIMKFAMEVDRRAVITIFAGYLICSVTYAVYSTLFLKYFIQMMQDRRVDLVPGCFICVCRYCDFNGQRCHGDCFGKLG